MNVGLPEDVWSTNEEFTPDGGDTKEAYSGTPDGDDIKKEEFDEKLSTFTRGGDTKEPEFDPTLKEDTAFTQGGDTKEPDNEDPCYYPEWDPTLKEDTAFTQGGDTKEPDDTQYTFPEYDNENMQNNNKKTPMLIEKDPECLDRISTAEWVQMLSRWGGSIPIQIANKKQFANHLGGSKLNDIIYYTETHQLKPALNPYKQPIITETKRQYQIKQFVDDEQKTCQEVARSHTNRAHSNLSETGRILSEYNIKKTCRMRHHQQTTKHALFLAKWGFNDSKPGQYRLFDFKSSHIMKIWKDEKKNAADNVESDWASQEAVLMDETKKGNKNKMGVMSHFFIEKGVKRKIKTKRTEYDDKNVCMFTDIYYADDDSTIKEGWVRYLIYCHEQAMGNLGQNTCILYPVLSTKQRERIEQNGEAMEELKKKGITLEMLSTGKSIDDDDD